MRILFITPIGGLTGSEMMLWYLLRQLSAQGHEVALFSMQRGKLYQQADEVSFQTFFYNQKRSFLADFYTGVYKKIVKKLPVESALLRFHHSFKLGKKTVISVVSRTCNADLTLSCFCLGRFQYTFCPLNR